MFLKCQECLYVYDTLMSHSIIKVVLHAIMFAEAMSAGSTV